MKTINNLYDDIKKYKTSIEQEEKDKEVILRLIIENGEKILSRESELFHITSSGFTVNETRNKILMVHHNIYKSWSWIGGHADEEADLLNVACKEVREESGVLHLSPVSEKIISIDILTTRSHYKNGKYVLPHLHLNISYLIEAQEADELKVKPDENSAVKWILIDEIMNTVSEEEMKAVYEKIIRRI